MIIQIAIYAYALIVLAFLLDNKNRKTKGYGLNTNTKKLKAEVVLIYILIGRKRIDRLVNILFGQCNDSQILKIKRIFYIGSFLLGLTSALLINLVFKNIIIITFLAASILPYIILESILQGKRVKNSKEGEILIGEIISNYKICHNNMRETLEHTVQNLEEAPNSRSNLLNLIKGLNTVARKDDVEKLLDNFSYSIGTSWGELLSTNIYFGLTEGVNVTASLLDLLEGIDKNQRLAELSKRGTMESNIMLKFLGPACYLLTVVGAIKLFGFTGEKFIQYQFLMPQGLGWFLLIIMFYIIGFLINVFVTNRKLDL